MNWMLFLRWARTAWIPVWFWHNYSGAMWMQILISVGGIQFDSIVNTCKYCNLNASASHQYLTKQHQWNSWASWFTVYLFSQFSSLETLLSLEAKPADAWSFMIWLAIICHGITHVRPLLWLLGHLEATSIDTFFFSISSFMVFEMSLLIQHTEG